MHVCSTLKGFCLRHEWAQLTFAVLGVSLFIFSIWLALSYQLEFLAWLKQNLLLHGLIFGAGTLLDALLIFGLLCLGFSECSQEDKHCIHAFRGRRHRPLVPQVGVMAARLGKNPRRS